MSRPATADKRSPSRSLLQDTGRESPQVGHLDLLLLLMAAMWGTNFSIIKVALSDLTPLLFASARFLLIVPVMVGLAWLTGHSLRVERRYWLRIAGLGLLGNTVYQLLFIFGADRTSADNAALILATVPLFVAVLGSLAGFERVGGAGWIGVGLSLVGIFYIVTGSEGGASLEFGGASVFGDLLVLLATLAWSAYTVWMRPVVLRCSPVAVTVLSTAVGSVPLLLKALPVARVDELAQVTTRSWLALAASGMFGICLPYFIWNYGIRQLGSARTSLYSYLVPFIALVVAWAWLGETLTVQQFLGGGLALAGVALARNFVRPI